jgi:DNA-binding MarR family transcriptional regulator
MYMVENKTGISIYLLVEQFINLKEQCIAHLPEDLRHLGERLPQIEAYRRRDYYLFTSVSAQLYAHDAMNMSELSDALGVPANTATRMVDWMVSNGYVERFSDPRDRRMVRVKLTATGRELHENINNHLERTYEQVFQGLEDQEKKTFIALLQKISPAASDERTPALSRSR